MKTVLISEENREFYAFLLPLQLAPLLYGDAFICIGLAEEGEEGLDPKGLLILSEETEDSATIEWIGLAEEEQNKGLSSLLLDRALEFVRKNEKHFLRARVRYLPEAKEPVPEESSVEGYFLNLGFAPETVDETERIFYVSERKSSAMTPAADLTSFRALSALEDPLRKACLKNLEMSCGVDLNRLNQEISTIFLKDEALGAVVIAEEYNGVFALRFIELSETPTAEDDIEQLLRYIVSLIGMKSAGNGVIFLKGDRSDPIFLAAEFFKEKKGIESKILSIGAFDELIEGNRAEKARQEWEAAEKAVAEIPEKVQVVHVEYLSGVLTEEEEA